MYPSARDYPNCNMEISVFWEPPWFQGLLVTLLVFTWPRVLTRDVELMTRVGLCFGTFRIFIFSYLLVKKIKEGHFRSLSESVLYNCVTSHPETWFPESIYLPLILWVPPGARQGRAGLGWAGCLCSLKHPVIGSRAPGWLVQTSTRILTCRAGQAAQGVSVSPHIAAGFLQRAGTARPLRLWLRKSDDVTSAAFYWSKQVTGPPRRSW